MKHTENKENILNETSDDEWTTTQRRGILKSFDDNVGRGGLNKISLLDKGPWDTQAQRGPHSTMIQKFHHPLLFAGRSTHSWSRTWCNLPFFGISKRTSSCLWNDEWIVSYFTNMSFGNSFNTWYIYMRNGLVCCMPIFNIVVQNNIKGDRVISWLASLEAINPLAVSNHTNLEYCIDTDRFIETACFILGTTIVMVKQGGELEWMFTMCTNHVTF